MSAAAFGVTATLLVLAAAALLWFRTPREMGLAAAATVVLLAVELAATGAFALAAVALVLLGIAVAGAVWALRRGVLGEHPHVLALGRPWLAAITGFAAGALVVVVAVASGGVFHRGSQTSALVTLVHYRAPVTLGVLALVLVISVAIGLLLGGVGDDETQHDRVRQSRREREERMRRRREDRAAARRRREEARSGAGSGGGRER